MLGVEYLPLVRRLERVDWVPLPFVVGSGVGVGGGGAVGVVGVVVGGTVGVVGVV